MKRKMKVLDVVAEKEDQVFIFNMFDIYPGSDHISIPKGTKVESVYDSVLDVKFDRVVLLRNKAIVQGTIHKNLILKLDNGELFQESLVFDFAEEEEMPGLNPTVTVGKFNRAAITDNVVKIGPDNQGTTAGFDVQIYVTGLTSKEILTNYKTKLDQKIILDFIIKISKFDQVNFNMPAPDPVFKFENKCK